MAVANQKLPPLLKWAGGKRWLGKSIAQAYQLAGGKARFVEPFCGGLSATLCVRPSSALLNDVNPHLINFYKQVTEGLAIDDVMRNDESFYYARRREFNAMIDQGEALTARGASLFYYLNKTGYNGMCRFNQNGQYNIPFGRHRQISYTRSFDEHRHAFRRYSFSAVDFGTIRLRKGDFVYADPPYHTKFSNYFSDGFSWDDHKRLVRWLVSHDGPVMVSNADVPELRKLFVAAGFKLKPKRGPNMISCSGTRGKQAELLATLNI